MSSRPHNGVDANADGAADEAYNSASDADFDPNNDEQQSEDDVDAAELHNSGDEGTISRAKGRKKRKHEEDEDEDGGGGLVKTRAQRRAETSEKKAPRSAGAAKADINAIWAQMSAPKQPEKVAAPENTNRAVADPNGASAVPESANGTTVTAIATDDSRENGMGAFTEPTVTIKRRYEFAGEVREEERIVPASSAEAKLYLRETQPPTNPAGKGSRASGENAAAGTGETGGTGGTSSTDAAPRRPVKRKSIFGVANPTEAASSGPKLNTLQKSKLDWAAHVDREGISEELDEASRGKGSHLSKVDFLSRMDAKREDELRSGIR